MKLVIISFLSFACLSLLSVQALANPTQRDENLAKKPAQSESFQSKAGEQDSAQTEQKSRGKTQKTNSQFKNGSQAFAQTEERRQDSTQTEPENSDKTLKANSQSKTRRQDSVPTQQESTDKTLKANSQTQEGTQDSTQDEKESAENSRQDFVQTQQETKDKTQKTKEIKFDFFDNKPEDEDSPSEEAQWSIDVASSFLLKYNKLLKQTGEKASFLENSSISIPYTEINLNYDLSKKLSFDLGIEFSYGRNNLDIGLEDLFFEYSEDSFILPFSFQWGLLDVDFMEDNSELFHKETLSQQALFPQGDHALGTRLEVHLVPNFSILTGWQLQHNKRESDSSYFRNPSSTFSSYFLYKHRENNIFVGYLKQDLPLEGSSLAYGTGADLNHSYRDWSFKFKTEFWKIKRTEPRSNLLTYYVFPYLKWNFIALGWLLGSSQENILRAETKQTESLLKLDCYFTENSYFSIERVKEYSSLFTENSWSFAIKSNFSL